MREAFKKRVVGHCYRCLASDHLIAQCRKLVRCLDYRGVGHFSRSCPSCRKAISTELRSRLTFPPNSIHSRITFSLLIHTSPQSPPKAMEFVPGQVL